jgi:type II secretory pathway pseudopilin PulG
MSFYILEVKMKKGLSLIMLIITIVIVLILSSMVILNLNNGNLVSRASEVQFKNDLRTYQNEISMYISSKKVKAEIEGNVYYSVKLNADSSTIVYDGNTIPNENIVTIITTMKAEDINKYVVNEGKLCYLSQAFPDSTRALQKTWLNDLGINAKVQQ